ncbi:MAG: ComEC family competence protein [Hyphomicrobiales bacterium]|nr:ComEC family competence protein [Hyphomicrobiales bacterium]
MGRHIGHPGGLVTTVSSVENGAAIGAPAGSGGAFAGFSLGESFSLREIGLQIGPRFRAAIDVEIAHRRLFLWLPVAAGAGVVLYFAADREPSLLYAGVLTAGAACLARLLRHWRAPFTIALVLAFLSAGFLCASLRSALLSAPVIDKVRVLKVTGTVEEMDWRRVGARFVLRVTTAEGLRPEETPYRLRLTLRETPRVEAGAFVSFTARVLPPARLVLPGGYDFARDAYFARIGGVGSVLGRLEVVPAPAPPGLRLALTTAIDRARNVLAKRIFTIVGGDEGAVAGAMVTGKRDLLSDNARELIREAGIFHIITISGVQMTLVAGMIFWIVRRMLAFSSVLALRYPIKKWAAGAAILGAIAYDVLTGSRVGTERALFMTLIVLAAVIADRRAITMRNLAYAAFAVILFEPEAVLGASFQLSFAAVSALVAVSEARTEIAARRRAEQGRRQPPPRGFVSRLLARAVEVLVWLFIATFCATLATASFMAYNFHELSPYVLIGNPLTLTIIEFFAVPGALLGALLYPLGLDGPVWHYVGSGIELIFWAAAKIAAAPNSTFYIRSFAPWAILFLTLGVLSAVLWRSLLMRLTALVFLSIGVLGAVSGQGFDVAIAPTGESAAVRLSDGKLAVIGARPDPFEAEQWLRADGDGREARALLALGTFCDKLGCVGRLVDGSALALVNDQAGFEEDCLRADIVVSRHKAPASCAAPLVFDRLSLKDSGAVTLKITSKGLLAIPVRSPDEDRPWSRAPKREQTSAGEQTSTHDFDAPEEDEKSERE